MKRKGFTLIELLAVIVILAIIALIATPMILGVIDQAKKGAAESSVLGYIDSLEKAELEAMMEGISILTEGEHDITDFSIQYKGAGPSKGSVTIDENGIIVGAILCMNDYYVSYNSGKAKVDSSKTCEDIKDVSNDYIDHSGANRPELLSNMIPVKYENNNWVYADIKNKWYDYDLKEWANAVILKTSPSKTYQVGDSILMDDIAQMYVWVPRYTYTIFNGNNESVPEQEIQIKFEKGITSSGTVSCIDNLVTDTKSEGCSDSKNGSIINGTSTYTHPVFTFGDKELTGIWVGKFETSTTDSVCLGNATEANCNKADHLLEIKPNTDSLRWITVSNMFNASLKVKTDYNIENADSHMMKNMEWGAVAYLTNSKYGRCTNGICEEVTINNVRKNETTYTTQTGCAGNSVSENKSTTCQNTYDTVGGVKASTTGNIYGIYDMSGGANEYTMSNMVNNSGAFYSSSAGFGSSPEEKYYDKYAYATSYTSHSRGKLGDATKETLSIFGNNTGGWNSDYAYFFGSINSWLVRGGGAVDERYVGAFHFITSYGGTTTNNSFRLSLVNAL